jgi:hypothetical protein
VKASDVVMVIGLGLLVWLFFLVEGTALKVLCGYVVLSAMLGGVKAAEKHNA